MLKFIRGIPCSYVSKKWSFSPIRWRCVSFLPMRFRDNVPISISPILAHTRFMHLVVRRGLALQNLESLKMAIFRLPGAESVLLNRTGDSFFLVGFRELSGRRKSISVEIPQRWLEDAGMMESVEQAVMQFAALMTENANHGRSRCDDPAPGTPVYLRVPP
jgi:hypothetical protein